MTFLYSMVLDMILATLLVIAILYCWRLDSKLKTMRKGGDDMVEAARELQTSLSQAQQAVESLRKSADAAGRDLQLKIDEARAVAGMPMSGRSEGEVSLRRRSST